MLRVLVGLLFLLAVLVGGVWYSYTRVKVNLSRVESVRPAFKSDLSSIIAAGFKLSTGNLAGALAAAVEGVKVSTEVEVSNPGFLPVYIPRIEHFISVGDRSPGSDKNAQVTPAMWLMPNESRLLRIDLLIPIKDIPSIALNVISDGGSVSVNVESRFRIVGFTIVHRGTQTGSLLEAVRDRISRK